MNPHSKSIRPKDMYDRSRVGNGKPLNPSVALSHGKAHDTVQRNCTTRHLPNSIQLPSAGTRGFPNANPPFPAPFASIPKDFDFPRRTSPRVTVDSQLIPFSCESPTSPGDDGSRMLWVDSFRPPNTCISRTYFPHDKRGDNRLCLDKAESKRLSACTQVGPMCHSGSEPPKTLPKAQMEKKLHLMTI